MDLRKFLQRSVMAALITWSGQSARGQTPAGQGAVGQGAGGKTAAGQVLIEGTVYDRSQRIGLPGVSVLAVSGAGTATDSLGHYHIRLSSGDSLYFSYLGRFTSRFPVKDMNAGQPFDMSLDVGTDSLPEVFVRSKNYLLDSLETRREYKKIFDYGGPDYLTDMKSSRRGGMGVGLDFDLLLNPSKARRMEAFQSRLLWQERENYIDHRWTRSLVAKVTGMEEPILDSFMRVYRPSYEFLQTFETDYQFYKYIADCGKFFSSVAREGNRPEEHGAEPANVPKGPDPEEHDSTARSKK
jgi:hypothetical protein